MMRSAEEHQTERPAPASSTRHPPGVSPVVSFDLVPVVVGWDGTRYRMPLVSRDAGSHEPPIDRFYRFCDDLIASQTPVAADPDNPDIPALALVAAEADVSVDLFDDIDGEARRILDLAVDEVGLAVIGSPPPPAPAVSLTIGELKGLVIHDLFATGKASKSRVGETVRRYEQILTAAAVRAGGFDRPAAAALDQMSVAIAGRKVGGGMTAKAMIDEARRVLIQYETRMTSPDGQLHYRSFSIRFAMALSATGMSQSELARRLGISLGTINHWVRGDRIPDQRYEAVVLQIERALDLPAGALVSCIVRRRAGQGRLPEHLWPGHLRGRNNARLRAKITMRLPDITGFDDAAVRGAILLTEKTWRLETRRGHRLLEKRRRNAILHTSAVFDADVATYVRWATTENADGMFRARAPIRETSAATYANFLRQIANFALSSACPADLAHRTNLRLPHVLSPRLLGAWFADRRKGLGEGEQENLTQVDRLQCLNGVIDHVAECPDLIAILRAENEDLLPRDGLCSDREFMARLKEAIDRLRLTLRTSTKKPTTGAHRLAVVLSAPRPLDVIDRILDAIDEEIAGLEPASIDWAIKVRDRLVIALLGQTGLRSETVGRVLYGGAKRHLTWASGVWHLDMPGELFKSSASDAFQDGRYLRDLVDDGRFNRYMDEYLRKARPVLLAGRISPFLFVTTRKGAVVGMAASVVQQMVVNFSRRAVGSAAPIDRRIAGLPYLTAHHVRDLLATSVLKATLDVRITADAIHSTEKNVLEHYVRWLPSDRAGQLNRALASLLPAAIPDNARPEYRPA